MKLNKFSLFLTAMCALAPLSLHPMFAGRSFMNRFSRSAMTMAGAVGAGVLSAHRNSADCAIVRAETFKKEGCADITLLGDRHDIVDPNQKRAMIRAIAGQPNIHVVVEDMAEPHRLSDGRILYASQGVEGSIRGVIRRLREEANVSVSNVECRLIFDAAYEGVISYKVAFDNYKEIIKALEVAHPTSPLDIVSNKILEHVKKRDYPLLESCSFYSHDDINKFGSEVVDIRALELLNKLKKKRGIFIAGASHCDRVALILKHLGYESTHYLASNDNRLISKAYEPYIPAEERDLYQVFSDSSENIIKPLPSPISPEQLADYFKNPDKYDEYHQKHKVAQCVTQATFGITAVGLAAKFVSSWGNSK